MRENIYNKFYDEETWKKVLQSNKDILNDFLLELRQGKKSQGTIYQYEKDIMIFFLWVYKFLDNRDILTITKKEFRRFSLYLTEDCGLSNARHNRILSATRSMLNYCENDDDLDYDNNAARKVKGLSKEPVRDIIFLTDEQILKLKDELVKRGEYQKATLLMLAYDSAGRKSELCQVKKQGFLDKDKNSTNKVIGKRRKVFNLICFSGTKELAKLWLEQRGDDDLESLWITDTKGIRKEADINNIYEWFMDMREMLASLEGKELDFNVHSLRHASLTNFGNGTHYVCRELGMGNGFPIEKLKLLAHHESVDTTQGYLPDTSNDELEEMFKIKIE